MESSLLWKSVLGEIELNVNPSIYATWFKKTKLISHDKEELVVGVPNIFTQRQLETQFQNLIRQALKKNQIKSQTLVYRIVSPLSGRSVANQPDTLINLKDATAINPINRWTQSYNQGLNPRYNFESFIVGTGNDLAYAACQAVVNNLGTKYNPLFIYGGVGIGKTHLIQATGNAILSNNPDLRVVYVTIEQFVQEFTNAIRYKQIEDFTKCYRNVDVLIIDDIQFIANKEKTQEEFFHTFNVLHEAGKQIIISSDKPPHSIPTLQARLQSRFEMGMPVDMQIPDLETRCAILKHKADAMNLKIDSQCVQFLASNITTNIRVLEGALNQLNIYCESHKIKLADVKIAQQIFQKQFIKMQAPKITAKQIIEKVSNYYQIKIADLIGPKRDKDIVLPRQISMYLMRKELYLSFPKIAKNLGRKDHTTAIHSIKKIEEEMLLNINLKQSIQDLREELKLQVV